MSNNRLIRTKIQMIKDVFKLSDNALINALGMTWSRQHLNTLRKQGYSSIDEVTAVNINTACNNKLSELPKAKVKQAMESLAVYQDNVEFLTQELSGDNDDEVLE